MKIALVTQGYQTAGGVQAVARWLREGLVQRGHEVHVFDVASSARSSLSRRVLDPRTWRRGPIMAQGTEDGLTMVGTTVAELEPLRYVPDPAFTERLAKFDVIQVVCGGPALARIAERAGRPLAIQVATFMKWERESILRALPWAERVAKTGITQWVSRLEVRALRACDVVQVENQTMFDAVREVAPSTRAAIAPPGVDTAVFVPSGPWNSDGPIVALGRLGEHRKGWDRIFSAYAALVAQWPEAPRLVAAGRGDLTPEVWDLIAGLNLGDRVDIRRDVPFAELVELLRSGSVFWQASHEEGLGIAALEAMACGLPVIATDTAGTRMTVLPGETGWLVPQVDDVLLEELVARTRQVLDGPGEQMALNGRQHVVDNFDAKKTLDTFEDLYSTLVRAEQNGANR